MTAENIGGAEGMRHNCPTETYIEILQKLHNIRVSDCVLNCTAIPVINELDHINDSSCVVRFPVRERLTVLAKPCINDEVIIQPD